jgi:hypothetical protein
MLISRTTFVEFQMCPKNTWLRLHKRELLQQFKISEFELHLVEQGSEVVLYALELQLISGAAESPFAIRDGSSSAWTSTGGASLL